MRLLVIAAILLSVGCKKKEVEVVQTPTETTSKAEVESCDLPEGAGIYTDESIETARKQAYDEGYRAGRREGETSEREWWDRASRYCTELTGDAVVVGWRKGIRGPGNWILVKVGDSRARD